MFDTKLQPRWLIVVVAVMVTIGGCQCGDEPAEDEATQQQLDPDQQDDPEDDGLETAFGLPLPPDHQVIRDQNTWVRVSVDKSLEELEKFFAAHVVDAEVVKADDRVRVVPLRPHSPQAEARHRTGPQSQVVINYRPGPESEELTVQGIPTGSDEEDDGEDAEQQDDGEVAQLQGVPEGVDMGEGSGPPAPVYGAGAEWLDDVRGQPVEIKTSDGDLLAPGAKWGEPYTPPDGSPLDQPIYRHNFGRPFGDWR